MNVSPVAVTNGPPTFAVPFARPRNVGRPIGPLSFPVPRGSDQGSAPVSRSVAAMRGSMATKETLGSNYHILFPLAGASAKTMVEAVPTTQATYLRADRTKLWIVAPSSARSRTPSRPPLRPKARYASGRPFTFPRTFAPSRRSSILIRSAGGIRPSITEGRPSCLPSSQSIRT